MLCLLLVAKFSSAQTFCNTVGGTGDDVFWDMVQSNDGGYVAAGHTNSYGAGDYDCYIVKFDTTGAVQWTRTVGGTMEEYATSIIQTSDGGYAVAGHTSTFGTGWYSCYVIKLDATGGIQWTRSVGGTAVIDWSYSIVQASDGGYAIAGVTNSYGAGGSDTYIFKLDSLGVLQWTRTVGGISADQGTSIKATNDGYIVAGETQSFGGGGSDIYIMKLDTLGVVQWTETVGGAGTDVAWAMDMASDGGIIIAGETNSYGAGAKDFYIVKLDSLGIIEWTRTVGGISDDAANAIVQTSDGGYIAVGYTNSYGIGGVAYIVKLDNLGVVQWTREAGGACGDGGISVIQTTDGDYVVAGATASFGAGGSDGYIIKLDVNGNACCTSVSSDSIDSGGTNNGSGGTFSSGSILGSGGISGSGGIFKDACIPLKANFSAIRTVSCTGTCIDFSDLSTGGPTGWSWSFFGTDSATSSVQNPVNICYDSVGTFDVELIITNGCINDTLLIPDFITVIDSLPITADFSTIDSTLCIGDCIDFNDLSLGDFIESWTWFLPGADSTSPSTQSPNNICYNSVGSFDVRLIIVNACFNDTLLIPDFIVVNPLPAIIANASSTIIPCQGDTAILTGSGAVSYIWDNGVTDGIPFTPSNTTRYTVVGTDVNNCVNTDSITITVNSDCPFFIQLPNAFTPNNDGENDKFYIRGAGVEQIEIRIYDRWGIQVFYGTTINNFLEGWDGQYEGRYAPNGVYVYVITGFYDDEEESIIKRTGNITLIR